MDEIFGAKWSKSRGQSAIDKNGQLTSVAKTWSDGLIGIERQQYVTAFKNLVGNHNGYIPDLIQFREYCTGNESDQVMDAIMCRLQTGDSYEWKNQLAFNFWKRYSFDLINATTYNVPKLISQNLKMIDKSSMFPLPDYSQPSITQSKQNDTSKKERQIFQSLMFSVLSDWNPAIFATAKAKIEALFTKTGTLDLIAKFKSKNYILPDVIKKPSFFQIDNNYDAKTKERLTVAKKAMFNFLNEVGVIA